MLVGSATNRQVYFGVKAFVKFVHIRDLQKNHENLYHAWTMHGFQIVFYQNNFIFQLFFSWLIDVN